jgi:hypothetical protein
MAFEALVRYVADRDVASIPGRSRPRHRVPLLVDTGPLLGLSKRGMPVEMAAIAGDGQALPGCRPDLAAAGGDGVERRAKPLRGLARLGRAGTRRSRC